MLKPLARMAGLGQGYPQVSVVMGDDGTAEIRVFNCRGRILIDSCQDVEVLNCRVDRILNTFVDISQGVTVRQRIGESP